MKITERINSTIRKISIDKNIDEYNVNWHDIAIELAYELNRVKKLSLGVVVGQSEQLSCWTCKLISNMENCGDCFKHSNYVKAT